MSKKNNQKIKIMALYDILRRETDEEHPMSTAELIAKLADMGIPAERKSLYEDIRVLNEFGYEVLTVREKANMYYVVDRAFDTAELKILLDAVQAAPFVTEKKTAVLVDKIASLAGAHRAELLKENIVCFDTVKHTNENVFYSVDTIDTCILTGRKCSFGYFDYDFEGQRVYRKGGERYLVNPIALVFSNDNYYLMAYGDKYENVAVYRVDRMDKVEAEGESVTRADWLDPDDVASYRKRAFSMFAGKTEEVSLVADRSVTDVIVDKFGERVNMLKLDENTCRVKVKVQVSPTFFGWLATFPGRITVSAPESVREAYLEHLERAASAQEKEKKDD